MFKIYWKRLQLFIRIVFNFLVDNVELKRRSLREPYERALAIWFFVSYVREDSLNETENQAISCEWPREQELFRTPKGWHGNPCELGNGFCAKHKTTSELPTGVSRTRPEARSFTAFVIYIFFETMDSNSMPIRSTRSVCFYCIYVFNCGVRRRPYIMLVSKGNSIVG